jgi:membrane protein YdbS with pleckstrin-like domain
MYRGLWGVLVNLFKVPQNPPTLPAHAGEQVQSFRPAEGYLRYMKLWFWIALFMIDIALTAGYIAAATALCMNGLWWVSALLLPIALAVIVLPDIVAYIAIHLKYDTTWYVISERSMRIRRGIWAIHEVTITFENVQNVALNQGPVQRHYGIANLVVQTAGGGGMGPKQHGTGSGHMGIIEGVANAPELRDQIMAKLRESKSAGLGDDSPRELDHGRRTSVAWSSEHLAALQEIRAQTRQLAAAAR